MTAPGSTALRTRVAVIGGGQNCEHDVSLASASSARSALDIARYDVVGLTIAEDGGWIVDDVDVGLSRAIEILQGCDVVLPLVHGPRGEDGSLAALCDFAGVPWVGSGVRAGALAMDKWATKLVAEAVGVATAPGRLITAAGADGIPWDGPVVVKPVAAGSSHGVALARDEASFTDAVAQAFAFDDRVLVEDVVIGREIDIAVLKRPGGDLIVSSPLEILNEGLFDYEAKYGGTAEFLIPAPLDDRQRATLESAAITIFNALGCSGVARIDFFLTQDGLVLNEVNTIPGMTAQSQVPRMFDAVGIAYPDLLDILVDGALSMREGVWRGGARA